LAASPAGSLVTGILAMAAGTAVSVPFIWPELRELRSL